MDILVRQTLESTLNELKRQKEQAMLNAVAVAMEKAAPLLEEAEKARIECLNTLNATYQGKRASIEDNYRNEIDKLEREHTSSVDSANASVEDKKAKILESEENRARYAAGVTYDDAIKKLTAMLEA